VSEPEAGLLPVPVPGPLLRLGAAAYGAVVAGRNRRFDRGVGVRRLPCPVISVGNLSVGGTGKTPVVAWVARRLAASGRRPVIALRGYRPDASGTSDEAALHRELLPEVPIAVGADRIAAIRALGEPRDERTVVVLDDGFQHRRLHRDFDLVLVDATRPDLADRLIPYGRLREPLASLARADALLVTRADGVDEGLATALARHHGTPPVAWSRHAWSGLSLWHRGVGTPVPVSWLDGRRLATLLGVGHPEAIRRQLAAFGGRDVLAVPARDHDAYGPSRLARILDRCRGEPSLDAVLTTAKDWTKLRSRWPEDLAVAVPDLAIEFIAGEAALESSILAALSGV
jgi:tetraacyldisaccharide 4'-kinase